MLDKLELLFFPCEKNNYKAKILHLSSLTFLVMILGCFQLTLTALTRLYPGILGAAANISPARLIELTNKYRTEKGLAPLTFNSLLVNAATSKAGDMFAQNYWAHHSPIGRSPWWFFKNVGYNYLYAGENLARDFTDPDTIVNAWMDSPTHRDNILNANYKEIGIVVVDGILKGQETTLVVQLFGSPTGKTADKTEEKNIKGLEEELSYQLTQEPVEQVAKKTAKDQLPENKGEEIKVQQIDNLKPSILTSSKFSSFIATKEISLVLIGIMLLVLTFDIILLKQFKVQRISGKSLVHFIFLAIILTAILLSTKGKIL